MFCSRKSNEKYKDHFHVGIYVCVKCDNELFSANSKFKHDTPWPAFTNTIREDSVSKEVETEKQESSDKASMKLFCGDCKNSIGHEFLGDGPDGASRFWILSDALKFVPI